MTWLANLALLMGFTPTCDIHVTTYMGVGYKMTVAKSLFQFK